MSTDKPIEDVLAGHRAGTTSPAALSSQADDFAHLSDQSVLRLYESIRHQVEADKALGTKYRLVGRAARDRAEKLREELVRREMRFTPIVWS